MQVVIHKDGNYFMSEQSKNNESSKSLFIVGTIISFVMLICYFVWDNNLDRDYNSTSVVVDDINYDVKTLKESNIDKGTIKYLLNDEGVREFLKETDK
jgi:predicted negative regulator of RcsB-dependent stress response